MSNWSVLSIAQFITTVDPSYIYIYIGFASIGLYICMYIFSIVSFNSFNSFYCCSNNMFKWEVTVYNWLRWWCIGVPAFHHAACSGDPCLIRATAMRWPRHLTEKDGYSGKKRLFQHSLLTVRLFCRAAALATHCWLICIADCTDFERTWLAFLVLSVLNPP